MALGCTIVGVALAHVVALQPDAATRAPPLCDVSADASAEERARGATEAVENAVARFTAGALDDALHALDRADCFAARPEHEFMRGAILVEQGACEAAQERFEVFLASEVSDADAVEARRLRDGCVPAVAEQAPQPLPEPPPPRLAVLAEPDKPTPTPCPPRPRPDALGIALTSAGVGLAAAGAGMLGGAQVLVRQAPSRANVAEHDRAIRTARGLNGAGWGAAAVGIAVVAGGVARLVVVRRRNRRERARWPAHCRAKK